MIVMIQGKKDSYKVDNLERALEKEIGPDGGYGAHLTHWSGVMNPINIDADAMRVLIRYYKGDIVWFREDVE